MLLVLVTLQLLLPPVILVRYQIVLKTTTTKTVCHFWSWYSVLKLSLFSRFPVQITGTCGVRMESAAVAVAAAWPREPGAASPAGRTTPTYRHTWKNRHTAHDARFMATGCIILFIYFVCVGGHVHLNDFSLFPVGHHPRSESLSRGPAASRSGFKQNSPIW